MRPSARSGGLILPFFLQSQDAIQPAECLEYIRAIADRYAGDIGPRLCESANPLRE